MFVSLNKTPVINNVVVENNNNVEGERFTLAFGFGGLSPWLFGSTLGCHMVEEHCSLHGRQKTGKALQKGLRQDPVFKKKNPTLYPHQLPIKSSSMNPSGHQSIH